MKQLAIGTSTEYDLNPVGGLPGVLIRLDGTDTFFGNDSTARYVVVNLHIGAAPKPLTGTAAITVTPELGGLAAGARVILSEVKTVTATDTIVQWQIGPIAMSAIEDTLQVYVFSNDNSDADITVVATVMEAGSALTDSNGRVDVGSWAGTTATLGGPSTAQKPDVNVNAWADSAAQIAVSASGYPQVDVFSVGNATPIAYSDFNDISTLESYTQADSALTAYDPPTRTEATTDKDAIITEVDANETKIDALNNVSTTDLHLQSTSALSAIYLDGLLESDSGFKATALADIQSEANDALVALNLDHLMKTAVASNANMTTEVSDGTVLSNIISATSDTSTFVVADDSLEAIRDASITASEVNAEVDTALNTAIPGTPTANSVNERVAAIDNKLPSKTYLSGSADSDGGVDTAHKADIQAECTDSLNAYDPPTNTELNARTLPTASYFDWTSDTVARVTLADTTTTNTDMVGTDNAALEATLTAGITSIEGSTFNTATDSLEAIRNRGDGSWVSAVSYAVESSAQTVAGDDTVLTFYAVTGHSNQNDFYKEAVVILTDVSNNNQKAVRRVAAYTGASRQITLDASVPFSGGMAVGDLVQIVVSAYAGVGITGGDATAANQALIQGAGYDSAQHSLKFIATNLAGAAGGPGMG